MSELNFKIIGSKIREHRRANPSLTALVKIANILQCSVDCFLCEEYHYEQITEGQKTLDSMILEKLEYCTTDKKERILKMIALL